MPDRKAVGALAVERSAADLSCKCTEPYRISEPIQHNRRCWYAVDSRSCECSMLRRNGEFDAVVFDDARLIVFYEFQRWDGWQFERISMNTIKVETIWNEGMEGP